MKSNKNDEFDVKINVLLCYHHGYDCEWLLLGDVHRNSFPFWTRRPCRPWPGPINQSWFNTSWGVFASNICGLLVCVSKWEVIILDSQTRALFGFWDVDTYSARDLSTATVLDMRTEMNRHYQARKPSSRTFDVLAKQQKSCESWGKMVRPALRLDLRDSYQQEIQNSKPPGRPQFFR